MARGIVVTVVALLLLQLVAAVVVAASAAAAVLPHCSTVEQSAVKLPTLYRHTQPLPVAEHLTLTALATTPSTTVFSASTRHSHQTDPDTESVTTAAAAAVTVPLVASHQLSPAGCERSQSAVVAATGAGVHMETRTEPETAVQSTLCHRQLLVATLDGRVTALDWHGGRQLWSVPVADGPLLRSSLSSSSSSSSAADIVPSLDGGLFRWRDQQLRPLPLSMQSLLGASQRVVDGLVISGATSVLTLGVCARSGRQLYRCRAADGCHWQTDTAGGGGVAGEVLVLSQRRHSLVAADAYTGRQRWNLSVATLEASVVTARGERSGGGAGGQSGGGCGAVRPLSAAVAEGRVWADQWQHQFESPLVSAWSLENGVLRQLQLFDQQQQQQQRAVSAAPLFYLGEHQRQLYVQRLSGDAPTLLSDDTGVSVPTNSPAHVGAHSVAASLSGGGLLLQADKCPNLKSPPPPPLPATATAADAGQPVQVVVTVVAPWSEWAGAAAVAAALILLVNVAVTRVVRRHYQRTAALAVWQALRVRVPHRVLHWVHLVPHPVKVEVEVVREVQVPARPADTAPPPPPPPPSTTVSSRYLTEFEPLSCLGRGGYGVVFEARNRLDNQRYAVKRIRLPRGSRRRRRMLREVACLAQLEHVNVVRYFNCWTEQLSGDQLRRQDEAAGRGRGGDDSGSACSAPDDSQWSCQLSVDGRLSSSASDGQRRLLLQLSPADATAAHFEEREGSGVAGKWRHRTLAGAQTPGAAMHMLEQWCGPGDSGNTAAAVVDQYDDDTSGVVFHGEDCSSSSSSSSSASWSPLPHGTSSSGISCPLQPALCSAATATSCDDDSVVFAASNSGARLEWSVASPPPSSQSALSRCHSAATRCDSPLLALQTLGGATDSGRQHPDSGGGGGDRDGGGDGGSVYLFIQVQLCRADTLHHWLQRTATAPNNRREGDQPPGGNSRLWTECVHIFGQILDGVEHVHRQRLMHRDLKPSNIFFAQDGTVKIGDFGLAAALPGDCDDAGTWQQQQQRWGHHHLASDTCTDQVGTRLYMSPEQCGEDASEAGGGGSASRSARRRRHYDWRVDVFALGVVLLELMVPLRTSAERVAVLLAARCGRLPPPLTAAGAAASLVTDMISHEPQQRPSIGEVRQRCLQLPSPF